MTTYGPCQRFTIRTLDAVITITGSNMVAAVTSCDTRSGPPPPGFSVADGSSSESGDADTQIARRDELGLHEVGGTVEQQQSPPASCDTELGSHAPLSEETLRRCSPDFSETHDIAVGINGNDASSSIAAGSFASDCESESGRTSPSSSISDCSDLHSRSQGDGESELVESSAELQLIDYARKCTDRVGNSDNDEREQSLVISKHLCSDISKIGEAVGNDADCRSKRGTVKRHPHDSSDVAFIPSMCVAKHFSSHHTVHTDTVDRPHVCDGEKSYLHDTHGTTTNSTKPHSCDFLRKSFNESSDLINDHHTHGHSREKPYSCDTCKKTFPSPWSLFRHVRVHTGEKPYPCDVCGKTFRFSWNVAQHARIHTGEKPYSCNTCGKTFTTSGNLNQHTRTHTGERPFSCDICGKSFKQRAHVTRHLRIHTREKPYRRV